MPGAGEKMFDKKIHVRAYPRTYTKIPCRICGALIPLNGLAQAAHRRMHERTERASGK